MGYRGEGNPKGKGFENDTSIGNHKHDCSIFDEFGNDTSCDEQIVPPIFEKSRIDACDFLLA